VRSGIHAVEATCGRTAASCAPLLWLFSNISFLIWLLNVCKRSFNVFSEVNLVSLIICKVQAFQILLGDAVGNRGNYLREYL